MKAWSIAVFELQRMFRDKGMFFGSIIMVVSFMLFMGLTFHNKDSLRVPVAVVNEDQGEYAKLLLEQLQSNDSLDLRLTDRDAAVKDIQNSVAAVGFVIPPEFSARLERGSSVSLQEIKLGENREAVAVREIIDNHIKNIQAAYVAAEAANIVKADGGQSDAAFTSILKELGNSSSIAVKSEYLKTVNVKAKEHAANVGYVVFFIMLTGVYTMSSILKEKKEGTLGRLLATAANRFEILTGHFLGVFIQSFIQVTLLVVLTSVLFKTYWGSSYLLLFAVICAFLFAVMGLGAMLSGLVKTYTQLDALAPMIIIPTSMLGGAFWPVDIMPDFMQKIALFIPQYWALDGINALVNGGGGSEVLLPVMVLLGFAVVFLGVGTRFLGYKLQG